MRFWPTAAFTSSDDGDCYRAPARLAGYGSTATWKLYSRKTWRCLRKLPALCIFGLTLAEAYSAPRWEDFLEQELAAGKDEKQAWSRYNLVFLMDKLSDTPATRHTSCSPSAACSRSWLYLCHLLHYPGKYHQPN